MSEVPASYRALQHAAQDYSKLQPHPFVKPMAQGLQQLLDTPETANLLLNALQSREKTSNMLGREDSKPYIINLFGHHVTMHLRDPRYSFGEVELQHQMDAHRNGDESVSLNNPDFWTKIMQEMLEVDSPAWINWRIRDTQTVVEERKHGVLVGLVAASLSGSSSVNMEHLSVLDIGGSAGFVTAALFDIESIGVETVKGDEKEIKIGVDQVIIFDDFDEDVMALDNQRSWVRSNSNSLGDTYRNPAQLEAYDRKMSRIRALATSKKLRFITRSKPDITRPVFTLHDRLAKYDFNTIVASTVLDNIARERTREGLDEIADFQRDTRGTEDWALFINSFAKLPLVRRDCLKFEEERWHGSSNPYPYRSFMVPAWQKGKPRFYEVAGWKNSRCLLKDHKFTPQGLLRHLGIRSITFKERTTE